MYTAARPSPISPFPRFAVRMGCLKMQTLANSVQLRAGKADVNDRPIRAWRELATDWRVWLSLALCLLVATVAWLLGYD